MREHKTRREREIEGDAIIIQIVMGVASGIARECGLRGRAAVSAVLSATAEFAPGERLLRLNSPSRLRPRGAVYHRQSGIGIEI